MMLGSPSVFSALSETSDAILQWIDSHTIQIVTGTLGGAVIVGLLHGLKLLGRYLCREKFSASHWPAIIGRALGKTRLWFMIGVAEEIVTVTGKAPTDNSKGVRLVNLPQVRDIQNEEFEKMLAGKETAKQALDNAVERGNAAIQQAIGQ